MGFLKNLDSTKYHSSHLILLWILFLLACVYFYHDSIHLFPSQIHAWTQSDRLALAMNFQQNGFDLFHPATFNLLTKDGITQVDFPIHDYLVAIISSLFNMDLVLTFRLYNLAYSLIGIFFIFKLSLLLTASFWRSFLIAFFVFSLPFYTYYQAGFLPSIPSFSNLFIGLYFFFLYRLNSKFTYWLISCVFLLLACLSRLPLVIFLVAISILMAFKWWSVKRLSMKELFPLLLSFAILLAYFFHNKYLADTYGSMFLQFFLPITSLSHFYEIVNSSLERWSGLLFGSYHAVFLFLSLLAGSIFLYKKTKVSLLQYSMSLLLLVSSLGVLLFFLVMGAQFKDHDYYLIDTFLPLIVLGLILCFSLIELSNSFRIPFIVISSFFIFYFTVESRRVQEKRYEIPYKDQIDYSVNAYKNTANKLEEWGIQKSDTLLVLNASSTNIPFTIWNRKGYTLLNTSKDSIQKYLTKDFQYAVLLDSFRVENIFSNYPGIIYELDRTHAAHGLAVYSKSKDNSKVGFFNNYIVSEFFDFEKDIDNEYISANLKSTSAGYQSEKSLEIFPHTEYSISYKRELGDLQENKRMEVFVSADFLNREDSSGVSLICQFGNYYAGRYFSVELKDSSKWQNKYFHFIIPAEEVKNQKEFALYFWNPGRSSLKVDNYSFIIYQ